MRRPAGGFGLLGVLLVLAACGDAAAGAAGDDAGAELTGRTFVSTGDAGIPGGGPLTLTFTDDGRLLAAAGCNSTNGPVELARGRIVAADLAMTAMGCESDAMASDEWVTGLLSAEPSWELDGDLLVLTAGERVVSLTDRDVLDPPVGLTGRRWDVDGLSDGEVASSVPAGVTAYLRIDGDVLTAFTGCNELTGTVTVEGDTFTVAGPAVTLAACDDDAVRQVEGAVLAVLAGPVRFSITGDRLALEAPSGHGLQAVSAD
ncbi:META domain-containing protein [Jiangella endophytica]|uniref:META domain-containing protein n=1 Tax=Jiangella endophytica TaxID=1623398 RepID=UPI000E351D20|nr:META domain-containing protein [Jiangella endophytica]